MKFKSGNSRNEVAAIIEEVLCAWITVLHLLQFKGRYMNLVAAICLNMSAQISLDYCLKTKENCIWPGWLPRVRLK